MWKVVVAKSQLIQGATSPIHPVNRSIRTVTGEKAPICGKGTLCRRIGSTEVGKKLEDICDVLMELTPLKFPTLVKLLQISMMICVSTAKCERSFSALKRIKTYLRSFTSEQRLTDTAILSIERDLADSLILNDTVEEFAKQHRRIPLH